MKQIIFHTKALEFSGTLMAIMHARAEPPDILMETRGSGIPGAVHLRLVRQIRGRCTRAGTFCCILTGSVLPSRNCHNHSQHNLPEVYSYEVYNDLLVAIAGQILCTAHQMHDKQSNFTP